MLSIPQRTAQTDANAGILTSRNTSSGHMALSLITVNLPQCSARMQIPHDLVAYCRVRPIRAFSSRSFYRERCRQYR